MVSVRCRSLVAVLLLGLIPALEAVATIKQSSSGLCHSPHSPWYERTRNFTPYPNIDAGGGEPQSKQGARGPDQWVPPAGRCQYVARFLRIVKVYRLEPSSREMNNLRRQVEQCGIRSSR